MHSYGRLRDAVEPSEAEIAHYFARLESIDYARRHSFVTDGRRSDIWVFADPEGRECGQVWVVHGQVDQAPIYSVSTFVQTARGLEPELFEASCFLAAVYGLDSIVSSLAHPELACA